MDSASVEGVDSSQAESDEREMATGDDGDEDMPMVPTLTSSNYRAWKMRMRFVFKRFKLWDVIEGPRPVLQSEEDIARWQHRDIRAMEQIVLNVNDVQLMHLEKLESAHDMWDKLKSVHGPHKHGAQWCLIMKLFQIKYHGGDMQEHIDNIMDFVAYLWNAFIDVDKLTLSAAILTSLPATYSSFVTSLLTLDEETLTVEYICSKLVSVYKGNQSCRKVAASKEDNASPTGTPLKAKSSKGGRPLQRAVVCWQCGQEGHIQSDSRLCLLSHEEEQPARRRLHQRGHVPIGDHGPRSTSRTSARKP